MDAGILAFDTSNYTTSAAVTDRRRAIVLDERIVLSVKQGNRGLRQSEALFQHVQNLPLLMETVFSKVDRETIRAVAVSSRPRPVEGSYMPVFLGGEGFGRTVAAALGVPLFSFSHQEGHLEAARFGTPMESCREDLLAYHLSGGTCELLAVRDGRIAIAGGSKDISFGQLLDRAGVAMGLSFPSGAAMDAAALRSAETLNPEERNPFSPISTDGLFFNVSGIETQFLRSLEKASGEEERERLIFWLFDAVSRCLIQITRKAAEENKIKNVLFSGGVSSSAFLRKRLEEAFSDGSVRPVFGQPALSSDNAVGIALLGGRALWD